MTIILGLLAIAAIIAGIIMTGVGQGKDSEEGNKKKGAMFLGISTVGFVLYVVIVRWYDIDGWAAILPQGVGMFIATLLLSIKDHPFNKYMLRNVLAGIMWAIGNIGLLLANPLVGVAVGFSFSQMGIIISTLGGIFLLGEKKSKKQLTFIIIGCALVIVGGVMLGFTKE